MANIRIIPAFVLFQLICYVHCKEIPSYIHLCKRNDPEFIKCFMNTMNEIRPYLIKGIPEMDLPPGDPLRYFDTSANSGKGTAASLEGQAWNQTATGVMDYVIKDISVDFDNAKFVVSLFFPRIRLQGDYKLKGKVLLLEIDATGHFDINATEVTAGVDFSGKFVTKKGKQHIDFENVDLKLQIKETVVYFGNLIEGNEELTYTLNQAINANMDAIIEDLLPILQETFAGITRRYFNQVFRLFPLDQLFPQD